jgi:hypothetical protein
MNAATVAIERSNQQFSQRFEGEASALTARRGPLPFEQSIKLGLEMAGTLDAHRKGIIHRDC